MTSSCRVPDCGATTDGFVCKRCGDELRVALRNPHAGDPDIPTLMTALSASATGRAHVYRAMRRPGEPDEELAELEEEHRWRAGATPPALRSKDGRVTLPATRSMVNLAARELLDEAWTTLVTWARHLTEMRGAELTLPPGEVRRELYIDRNRMHVQTTTIRRPDQTRMLADWLAERCNSFRHDEAGPDAHADLTQLRERLLRAVDRAPSRIYAGPCQALTDGTRCDRPLYAKFNPFRAHTRLDEEQAGAEDGRVVVCDGYRPPLDPKWDPADEGCGAEHTAADRQGWLIADLEDRLYPIGWWAHWLPQILHGVAAFDVPRGVIMSWAKPMGTTSRSRLLVRSMLPHSIDRDARELFRGGDVMDLMAQYRPKRYAPRRRSA